MTWIILGLGSAFFAALVAIFGKIGLQNVDSTMATALRSVIMAVFLVLVTLSFDKFHHLSSVSSRAWLYIALSGIAGALSWLCYFLALKIGPVGGVVALDRTSVVMALILAALFLSEGLTWKSGFGSILVVAGAILIAIK